MNVVFDTNVYIDLTEGLSCEGIKGRARRLQVAEKIAGIRALASPDVMIELLAHLHDPTDPCLEQSVRAISLLAEHCRIPGQDTGLNVVAAVESEICRVLFGDLPEGHEDAVLNLGTVCELVSCAYLSTGNANTAASLPATDITSRVSTTAAIREAAFKQDFRNVMSSIDPAGGGKRIKRRDQHAPDYLGDIRSDDMLPNLALSAVYQAAGLANRKLTEEDAGRYALRVATLFRPHLEVLREMWIRVVTTGFDIDHPKRHRANIVWDMYIAALASGVIDGQPVLLVTGDSMIIEACGRAGCINGVSRLADYLDSIGISWLA